jgi:hypothetical protein
LTKDDFGPVSLQPLVKSNWEGTIKYDSDLTPREAQMLESELNMAFSSQGADRERRLLASESDYGRDGQLQLLEAPLDGGPSKLIYDTKNDPTPRSCEAEMVRLGVARGNVGPLLYDNVSNQLKVFSGGSEQFSEAIRTVTNQGIGTLLTHIIGAYTATQSGVFGNLLRITLENCEYKLTRLSPRPAEGEKEGNLVEYQLEAIGTKGDNNVYSQVSAPFVKSRVVSTFKVRLAHDTVNDQVRAYGLESHLTYEIDKRNSAQPNPPVQSRA